MNPKDLLDIVGGLGVGGILAAALFWVYRNDAQSMSIRMEALTKRNQDLADKILTVMTDSQRTLGAHTALLDAVLKHLDKG